MKASAKTQTAGNVEILFRNASHTKELSHDCLICKINGKTVKMTYDAYNAVENAKAEVLFDNGFSELLSLTNMGFLVDRKSYIREGAERKKGQTKFSKKPRKCLQRCFNKNGG